VFGSFHYSQADHVKEYGCGEYYEGNSNDPKLIDGSIDLEISSYKIV
jgi:hypothetical protein